MRILSAKDVEIQNLFILTSKIWWKCVCGLLPLNIILLKKKKTSDRK